MTGQAAPHRSRTLSERERASERHSRFVERMKVILPAVSSVFLCLLLFWPWMTERLHDFRLEFPPFDYRSADSSTIVNPRFMGSDKNDEPFVISAERATGLSAKDGWILLVSPRADLNRRSGDWFSLESHTGHISEDHNLVTLEKDVFLYRNDGTQFMTEEAVIDLSDNRAFGDKPVDGRGPDFTVASSSGFEVENGGAVIRFLGKSRMQIGQQEHP
ncbi:LPS export ABC transporter periplasmic protein LptC [Phaeovibrio sulfidiphilus]|uniref:LPS export ABC transporter periplasmic protein LptC n=1 Tax=Phaeovibrio sulfidiphilus TaxID=1220600 RepID=A0A8J6YP54_9PROT|nr:LPS export ABC transporter periplasmic protein LptC [Phaeovibrio sulfidiphilus]MBE1236607.1 LPS export ABC transporter periplasmic protein LptC [Phaeovibrio sulfidiphilus]